MRITGGLARGIHLKVPQLNDRVRPSTDRMREAVFSSLGPLGNPVAVLDLYAGTGAYGLEALSRGAGSTVFVESDPRVLPSLEMNLQAVSRSAGVPFDARILRRRLPGGLENALPETFDLIFIDPPYDRITADAATLLRLAASSLGPGGKVIFECPGDLDPLEGVPGWRTVQILGTRRKNAPSCRILMNPGTE